MRRRSGHRRRGRANRSRGIPAAVAGPTLRYRAVASQPKRGVHQLHQAHLPAVQLVDQRQTHRSRLGQDGDSFSIQREIEAGVAVGGQGSVRSDLPQRRRPARIRADLRGRSEGQGFVSG